MDSHLILLINTPLNSGEGSSTSRLVWATLPCMRSLHGLKNPIKRDRVSLKCPFEPNAPRKQPSNIK
ncbi:hypothetical protein I7I50_01538 [Histoplasma capsulatum G186AR]|uniref:Uncharacterized protein n=1 Tax=Ajellomyces capsulatus TaxID=5037 RepID=A0A8H7YDC0_AJECA|nr:hypothetical protein I7I52_12654 [Histoplasma capsulatum]QSS73392.1 hypothetical protein I7I50_01538 [Histoplasma capsulatum G186AR]